MALHQGRSARTINLFKNGELDFQFMRSLSTMSEGGATVGECLIVRDKATDAISFAQAWLDLGQQLEARANLALKAGHPQTAFERFKRATNYYRSGLSSFSPIESPDDHRKSWEYGSRTFEQFGAMFDAPMQRIDVPFEGGVLPCYWLKPDLSQAKRPSLMAFTGGEGTAMEMYFWIGAAGVRRGYNVFLCEIPGNIGTMYRNHLQFTLRHDTEKPIGAILDTISDFPGVDPTRIGATGYSYGGYFASRAACFDRRIAALAPDTPLHDAYELWSAVLPAWFMKASFGPKILNRLATTVLHHANKNSVDIMLWLTQSRQLTAAIDFTRACNLVAIENQIKCPVLALSGDGEGKIFNSQAEAFFRGVGSASKQQYRFTRADGGGGHCQVDNYNLLQEVTYDWLDEVLSR